VVVIVFSVIPFRIVVCSERLNDSIWLKRGPENVEPNADEKNGSLNPEFDRDEKNGSLNPEFDRDEEKKELEKGSARTSEKKGSLSKFLKKLLD
jgi:hypothetical protein